MTPIPVSASFTSSSLYGLMIASIFFMRWVSSCPAGPRCNAGATGAMAGQMSRKCASAWTGRVVTRRGIGAACLAGDQPAQGTSRAAPGEARTDAEEVGPPSARHARVVTGVTAALTDLAPSRSIATRAEPVARLRSVAIRLPASLLLCGAARHGDGRGHDPTGARVARDGRPPSGRAAAPRSPEPVSGAVPGRRLRAGRRPRSGGARRCRGGTPHARPGGRVRLVRRVQGPRADRARRRDRSRLRPGLRQPADPGRLLEHDRRDARPPAAHPHRSRPSCRHGVGVGGVVRGE